MTPNDVRDRYLIKAEKNGVNDGIATDKLRFSTLYNEAQNKFLTLHLQNRGSDDIRYVQNFLVLDKKLEPKSKNYGKYNFELPKKYFDTSSLRALAKKGNCSRLMTCIEAQTENINQLLEDEFTKPSFEWDEVLYTINSDQLSIYTDSFEVDNILLNYYRYPSQMKLVDDTNPESDFLSTSLIEWDDKSLDDIISLMVFNLDINSNNQRFQLQTLRTQK